MGAEETTSRHRVDGTDTPVYDAMIRALTTTEAANEPAGGDTATEQDGVRQDPGQDPAAPEPWQPSTPRVVVRMPVDPDTPEGAAIVRLFRRFHDLAQGSGDWPGADVVMALNLWFAEGLGIDPEEPPAVAETRLRRARCGTADGRPMAAVYGIRLGTDHHAPEPIIHAALHDLTHRLGPGTGIRLIDGEGNVLAHFGQHPSQ